MNGFTFRALPSYPTPGGTQSQDTSDTEDSVFGDQNQVTDMTRTRKMVKEEPYHNGNQNYEDAEMGDDVFEQSTADDLPVGEYERCSSGTIHAQDNNFQRQRELSLPHRAVSEADDGIRAMGREVAAVARAMAELRALGISHNYGVPELCALGEQSAGKSSLIGALAGIHLPSGPGTCTRVPVQIKTADDPNPEGTWVCKIYLELAYAHGRIAQIPDDCTRIGSWWEKGSPDLIDFMTIANKEELKEAMKAAQMAILNPQHNPTDYVPGIGQRYGRTTMMESFSPNLIVLQITEPGHQTLSFIDLPGIIQIGATNELVTVVSKLVKHFIRRKNTLLLCALPMSTDPQNSAAIRYVKDAKATDRCLGVLTKPDLLNDGGIRDVWKPLLRGQKEGFKMGHSYYVTKQPSHGQEISHVEARIQEEAFFDTEAPWTTELLEFRDRCGTKVLRDVLAKKLAYCIQLELPNIQLKIDQRAAMIDRRLNELPKPALGEVQPKLLRRLQQFSMEIQKALETRSRYFMGWRNIREQFRDAIILLKPVMLLKDRSDETSIPPQKPNFRDGNTPLRGNAAEPVVLDDSDDDSVVTHFGETHLAPKTGTKRQRSPESYFATPIKKKTKATPTSTTAKVYRELVPENHFVGYRELATKFALQDVLRTIKRIGIIDLPGDVDPQARNELCQRGIEIWRQPMELLLGIVKRQLENLFKDQIDNCLADYFKTDLYSEASLELEKFLNLASEELKTKLELLYEMEFVENPFTVNEEAFNRYKRASMDKIKEVRKRVRARAYQDRLERNRNKYTYGHTRLEIMAKITNEQLGPDPFEKEIECMAHIQGYYMIASMRWVDNVCQAVQSQLFNWIRVNIQGRVERKLGLIGDGGAERCRVLVERIDPAVFEERKRLQSEKESLMKAHQRLELLFEELARHDHKPIPMLPGSRGGTVGSPPSTGIEPTPDDDDFDPRA